MISHFIINIVLLSFLKVVYIVKPYDGLILGRNIL